MVCYAEMAPNKIRKRLLFLKESGLDTVGGGAKRTQFNQSNNGDSGKSYLNR